ncbi:CMP/dCMP deaminase zinc-binding protein [Mycena venus]|uniref:CMP/dCMP deaminase zinc-binding protein n=1 Tax=Mycena venus TaxID=2733690 RepID=A0A8H7CFG5_9AGAR|nr:CMP/dCMP deaminase zinc-binding protein [Mycena venus]
MVCIVSLLSALILVGQYGAMATSVQNVIAAPNLAINSVNSSTRAYWMRRTNEVLLKLGSPCPFSAFASIIVNHTVPGLGKLVCTGGNTNRQTGNPTLHGEIAAINNCSAILTDPSGPYKLSPARALDAFAQLSLYTNAESCPMCASAIRWAGFREYIYGTSIETLIRQGWAQIRIPSLEVFRQSFDLPDPARLIGEVLTNETDPYLVWQFNPEYPCPTGCVRSGSGSSCTPVKA